MSLREPDTNVSDAHQIVKDVLAEESEKLRGIPMVKARALLGVAVRDSLKQQGFKVENISLNWPNITIIATAPGESTPVASNLRVNPPTSNL